eukprot:CAMPEP_0113909610 /NCGR_PEP_ID=MMETSP0780_2-20120614/26971_1 /TAXON_ID=652834 /ORGANISM="Palpitomonas bilix" /LENGTH=72 /DNA_ID=CAMNT_0000905485 /DNA_START=1235 /DNA_END=1449 /DNA_ORIENTATION=- /assembly_acc=CAM_ASM_000599
MDLLFEADHPIISDDEEGEGDEPSEQCERENRESENKRKRNREGFDGDNLDVLIVEEDEEELGTAKNVCALP